MVHFSKVLLAINKVHTMPQRALDCGPGLGGFNKFNQVYRSNRPTPRSVYSICGKYINIFTRCTNRNQHDTLMTAVANVSKGQTRMSYGLRVYIQFRSHIMHDNQDGLLILGM